MSAAFLVTFVASFALAGFSYAFCFSMGQARAACCCHAAHGQDESVQAKDDGPGLDKAPCCETRSFDALSTSSSVPHDPAPAVAPAPAAVLPDSVPVVAALAPRTVAVSAQERPLPMGRAPPPNNVHLRTVRLRC